MGHVSSKEVSAKPFFADLHTAKGSVDRLVAVSMTQDNFPSVDHPLFQQFVNLRCDPSVLHWFDVRNSDKRSELPAPPTAEDLYQQHVVASTDLVAKASATGGGVFRQHNAAVAPENLRPIPLALFRFVEGDDAQTSGATSSSTATTTDFVELAEKKDLRMVGYLSCAPGTHRDDPNLRVFLDKSLWNEAKSISIFQIGCKCYEHFSHQLGIQPQWPKWLVDSCLDTNLPKLRQSQVIYRQYQPQGIKMQKDGPFVTLSADGLVAARICTALAASVTEEFAPPQFSDVAIGSSTSKFHLTTHRAAGSTCMTSTGAAVVLPPAPDTPLDELIRIAKDLWEDSNAVVVEAKKLLPQTSQPKPKRRSKSHKSKLAMQNALLLGKGLLPDFVTPPPPPADVGFRNASTSHSEQGSATSCGNGDATPGLSMHNNTSNNSTPSSVHAGNSPPPMMQPSPSVQMTPQRQVQPALIQLPFQTDASILMPTSTPGVLQPFPVKWCENGIAFKPSSQRSQHPGMLLEMVSKPQSGSINVISVNGVMPFVVPDPCYVNLAPGATVFVSL